MREPSQSRISPNTRMALVGIAFAAIMLVLLMLGGGKNIPGAGTPVLNYEATDAQRTIVAEAALAPLPDATWDPFIRGRRKDTHDLLWLDDVLYVATDDGLLILDSETGEFTLAPGFPEDTPVQRIWVNPNDDLTVGLGQNYLAYEQGDESWAEWVPVSAVFPQPYVAANDIPQTVLDMCEIVGLIEDDGTYWVACAESVARVVTDNESGEHEITRYLPGGLQGIPGEPTGPLEIGPDGRLYVGLDNGVAALAVGD